MDKQTQQQLHDSRRRRRSPHRQGYGADIRHKERREVSRALPFGRQHLDKHDLDRHEALFASYLDVQKALDLRSLPRSEVKGRWKSFIGKWNRGELARGWYDPDAAYEERRASQSAPQQAVDAQQDQDSSDDDIGPHLPTTDSTSKRGPTIPSLQDLDHRRELQDEARDDEYRQLQHDRKAEREVKRDRLEELVPRADPGSRERKLEKKHDKSSANRSFADARDGGAAEVADSDLMGADGIDAYKAKLKSQERLKNEREIRREEALRARIAEREERLAEHRRKEEKTMAGLKMLAAQRFGGGAA